MHYLKILSAQLMSLLANLFTLQRSLHLSSSLSLSLVQLFSFSVSISSPPQCSQIQSEKLLCNTALESLVGTTHPLSRGSDLQLDINMFLLPCQHIPTKSVPVCQMISYYVTMVKHCNALDYHRKQYMYLLTSTCVHLDMFKTARQTERDRETVECPT